MYIQPTSDNPMTELQIPHDYSGTAFDSEEIAPCEPQQDAPPVTQHEKRIEDHAQERGETEQESPASEKAQPTFAGKGRGFGGLGGLLGKLSLSNLFSDFPLLSSLAPPARSAHKERGDLLQWVVIALAIILLLNDDADDILPLLLLLLLWD